MNENMQDTSYAPAAQDVIELDMKDLLAALLLRWKKILCWVLVGAALGICFALVKNATAKEQTIEEKIVETREKLSDREAENVERLFSQYKEYKALELEMADYYSRLTSVPLEEDSVVEISRKYLVCSSIENLGSSLTDSVLTESDYHALRDVSPDEEIGLSIYDRVMLSCTIGGTKYSNSDFLNNSNQIYVFVQQSGDTGPNQYLISVALYGKTKSDCEEMMTIVDAALQRSFRSLSALDSNMKVITTANEFNDHVFEDVNRLRKSYIDKISSTSKDLTDLNSKANALASDQKTYFNLLKEQYEREDSEPKITKTSARKWAVVLAFLGGVLGVALVVREYLFDGTVKTTGEMESAFHIPVLGSIFLHEKKTLFDRWCSKLCGVDNVDPSEKVEMLATDLDILLQKANRTTLYLLCSGENKVTMELAEKVKLRLLELNPNLKIYVGDPLTSADEMKKAGLAELGLVIAELAHSKRAVLRQWRQLCSRYNLPLAGIASVRRCWIG